MWRLQKLEIVSAGTAGSTVSSTALLVAITISAIAETLRPTPSLYRRRPPPPSDQPRVIRDAGMPRRILADDDVPHSQRVNRLSYASLLTSQTNDTPLG